MRVLLDTHALIWFCEGSSELSGTARAIIEDTGNERFVSHATAWEVAIKCSIQKLKLQFPYNHIFPRAIAANGFQTLTPSFQHYEQLLQLPLHHRDPFDRLLIAQAQVEDLTLVTRDPDFTKYGIPVIW